MDATPEIPETPAALRAEIDRLTRELAERKAMIEILMDHNPDGILIVGPDGSLEVNPAAAAMMRSPDVRHADRETVEAQYGNFRIDRTTPIPYEDLPGVRATKGEHVDEVIFVRGPNRPEGAMLQISARPLPNGRAISVFRDVTERMALEADIVERNERLAQREAENRELIERLRVALDELSTPVLEVREDVLVLPVIGLVDSQRSAQMSERLLAEVVRTRARHVIVDLTGVELIDTGTADRFGKLARAVELLGARCVLAGLQPAVAQTLVELGVSLAGLETQRNLRHALETCGEREKRAPRAAPRAAS